MSLMQVWGLTDTGLVRKENQDAYAADQVDGHTVCVVCDGMGGAKAGNVASLVAVETFVDALKEMGSQEESRPAIPWPWLAAGGGGVVVLAAVGSILYRRKKKAAEQLTAGGWEDWDDESPNGTEEKEP